MSETLTDSAPVSGAEVDASVEADAAHSETTDEVGDGSSRGEEHVPASRFNGLMGRFNREQNARAEAERRATELEAELASLRTPKEDQTPVADDDLRAEVAALRNLLLEERTEAAKARVLDEFPEAKPFADLIVGDDIEDIRGVAEEIANRVKAATGGVSSTETAPSGETSTSTDATGTTGGETSTPEVPVLGGGGTTFSGAASLQEQIDKAIEAKDWGAFMNLKFEKQQVESSQG